MRIVRLARLGYLPMATFGMFRLSDALTLPTVELPWKHNQPNVSCIPVGVYIIKLDDYKGEYPDYKVLDVPNRWAIEIHRANVPTELRGCIAPGTAFGYIKSQWGVTNSKIAHGQFMNWLNGDKEAIMHVFNETGGV